MVLTEWTLLQDELCIMTGTSQQARERGSSNSGGNRYIPYPKYSKYCVPYHALFYKYYFSFCTGRGRIKLSKAPSAQASQHVRTGRTMERPEWP